MTARINRLVLAWQVAQGIETELANIAEKGWQELSAQIESSGGFTAKDAKALRRAFAVYVQQRGDLLSAELRSEVVALELMRALGHQVVIQPA